MNPCKQCIVGVMCRNACKEFETYLEYIGCKHELYKSHRGYREIARYVRRGSIILRDDDKVWRWNWDE